jgi:hypothetical protein
VDAFAARLLAHHALAGPASMSLVIALVIGSIS